MCLVQQSRDANSVILLYFSRQAFVELLLIYRRKLIGWVGRTGTHFWAQVQNFVACVQVGYDGVWGGLHVRCRHQSDRP